MRPKAFVNVRGCASVQVRGGATFADVRHRSPMSRPVAVKLAVNSKATTMAARTSG